MVEIQTSEEEDDSSDGEDEAGESDDDADAEGTASVPVVTPAQLVHRAPCLRGGLRTNKTRTCGLTFRRTTLKGAAP